jgi:hypothetical protein
MISAGSSLVWQYPIEEFNAATAAIRIYAAMKDREINHC